MGIQGLLIGLKPYTASGNILDYADQSVAVDASSWMHKSIYSIADHYVECQERHNDIDQRCIDVAARYMTQRCRELHDGFRVGTIYLVMDGKRSPLKAGTNHDRDERRAEQLRLARRYAQQQQQPGRKKDTAAAFEKYKSCIKIVDALTVPVVRLVAQRLHYVRLIWSPYEADAQLAQLCQDGRAAVCITEDSDVLVYSAAAQIAFPIIYKLDRRSGNCDVISMNWLLNPVVPPVRQSSNNDNNANNNVSQLEVILDKLRLRQQQSPGWGARLFVMACVLAGCDYSPRQIFGIGLVKAFKLVKDAGITGSDLNLAKIFRYILHTAISAKSRGSVKDETALEEQLAQSEAVFYYHPVQRSDGRIAHLISHDTPFAPQLDRFADCSFLGSLIANEHDDENGNGIIPARATMTRKSPPSKKHPTTATARPIVKNPIHSYFTAAQQKQIVTTVVQTPPRPLQPHGVLVAKRRQPPSSATSSLSSPSVEMGDDDDYYDGYAHQRENVQNFVTVAKRKKKKTSQMTTNPPAINPYTKKGQAELKRHQALASYRSRHDEPETMQRIHRLVTLQIPWSRRRDDTTEDVRGVKRQFPYDGTRIINPQQKVVVVTTSTVPGNTQERVNQATTTTATQKTVTRREPQHHDHQPLPPAEQPTTRNGRFEKAFARPTSSSSHHHEAALAPLPSSSRFFYDDLRTTSHDPNNISKAGYGNREEEEPGFYDNEQQLGQHVVHATNCRGILERVDGRRFQNRDENDDRTGQRRPLRDNDAPQHHTYDPTIPAVASFDGPNCYQKEEVRETDRRHVGDDNNLRTSRRRHHQPFQLKQNNDRGPTIHPATDFYEPDRYQEVRAVTDRPSHCRRQPHNFEHQENGQYRGISFAADETLLQSPFFANTEPLSETVFHSSDEPVRPDPTMDSENLFAAPPSPNLLLDPTQEEEDEEEDKPDHYSEPICFDTFGLPEARRVTMAHAQPEKSFTEEPSFEFYHQDCSPEARRPPGCDHEVVDLLGDESENDEDLNVLNVSSMVAGVPKADHVDYRMAPTGPLPPRERSMIGPAKTHRNRFRASDSHVAQDRRLPSDLDSFLAKNRKRRSKQGGSNNAAAASSSLSASGKKQKQTSILSHFKIGDNRKTC